MNSPSDRLGAGWASVALRAAIDDASGQTAVCLLHQRGVRPSRSAVPGGDTLALLQREAAGNTRLGRYESRGGHFVSLGPPTSIEPAAASDLAASLLSEAVAAGGLTTLVIFAGEEGQQYVFGSHGMRLTSIGRTEWHALTADLPGRPLMVSSALQSGAGHQEWAPPDADRLTDREQSFVLAAPASAPLLQALGMLTPKGDIRRDERRKYNQINHLLGLLTPVLATLRSEPQTRVVDCGCGKSQLLFAVNHVMATRLGMRGRFWGLDTDAAAIANARHLQAVLGYTNMEFVQSPIRSWEPDEGPDVVLSLHACDTATDEALALGIAHGARAIFAVPCCQAEASRQLHSPLVDAAVRHGVMRRRLGDWLTDAIRSLTLEASGYQVRVVEYVSPLDTPKNVLLIATRVQRPEPERVREAAAAMGRLAREFGLEPSLPRLIDSLTAPRR